MDKTTYRALTTEERINYLNLEMAAGKKLSHICKGIGIADNVTTPLRAKGYIRNEEGLFIKRDPQHPGQINLDHLKTEDIETAVPKIGVSEVVTEGKSSLSENNSPEPKRVGRPPRLGTKIKKLTIEISEETHKALMHFKIDEGLYVNGYIENLIRNSVPGKYFKPI